MQFVVGKPSIESQRMAESWTRDETLASGQVFEFRVWAALTEQSRGQLHVFLPMSDRGIDGMVHRLTDGAYIPVQAKGRSILMNGEVHLVVRAESVADDSIVIVSGLIVDGGLGPAMLAVPAADFRRLADLSVANGRQVYGTAFEMDLLSQSKWRPWMVAPDRLQEKFGMPSAVSIPTVAERPRFVSEDLGFLGEAEVVRRLAEADDCNLFRPFPDLETAELVVRHRSSGRVIGFQVKTVTVDAAHPSQTVSLLISSFRPAPTTYFVVLAWIREERRFHPECLVFPSEKLLDFAREGSGHLKFAYSPGSTSAGRLNRYRRAVTELLAATQDLLVGE
jgi:hypothetical protein